MEVTQSYFTLPFKKLTFCVLSSFQENIILLGKHENTAWLALTFTVPPPLQPPKSGSQWCLKKKLFGQLQCSFLCLLRYFTVQLTVRLMFW